MFNRSLTRMWAGLGFLAGAFCTLIAMGAGASGLYVALIGAATGGCLLVLIVGTGTHGR